MTRLDLAVLAVLSLSCVIATWGICLMALWTWRGIVSVAQDALDGCARGID